MRWTSLMLLLMISAACAITVVGTTDDGTIVLAEKTYVAKVNVQENWFTVNNIIKIPIFPKVFAETKTLPVQDAKTPELTPGQKINSLTIDIPESVAEEIYSSVSLNFEEEFVEQVMIVENSAEKVEKPAEVELLPQHAAPVYLYAPYIENAGATYLMVSPLANDVNGHVLVMIFDLMPSFPQPQATQIKSSLEQVLFWSFQLGPNEKKTFSIRYLTGYITNEEKLRESGFNPSLSKQYVLHADAEPLLDMVNKEVIVKEFPPLIPDSGKEFISQMSAQVKSYPHTALEPAGLTLSMDINEILSRKSQGLNSIEKSLIYREILRAKGLPAELHIGYKDTRYYGWVNAYLGTTPTIFDPADQRLQYEEVYVEPAPKQCKSGNPQACPWSGGLRFDQLCIGNFCISVFIIIGLVLLGVIAVFLLLQYRPDIFYGLAGVKVGEKGQLPKEEIGGSYNFIKEDPPMLTPLHEQVWTALKRRSGMFKPIDVAKETGFSEVLVKSAVEEFVEGGFIKKRG